LVNGERWRKGKGRKEGGAYQSNNGSKNRRRRARPPIDREIPIQKNRDIIPIGRNVRNASPEPVIHAAVSPETRIPLVVGIRRVVLCEIGREGGLLVGGCGVDVAESSGGGVGAGPGSAGEVVGGAFGLEDAVSGIHFRGADGGHVGAAAGG